MTRQNTNKRSTKETDVTVSVELDGTGKATSSTGVAFVDHLIVALGTHSMMDLTVSAKSNDGIEHHLIEDTAIAIGEAIDAALGERHKIARFGHASVPMDESLSDAAVDLVKRQHYTVKLALKRSETEGVSKEDIEHFFESLLQNINCCIHLTVMYGKNDHHKIESAIKSLAVALRAAVSIDPRQDGIPSTKGKM